MRFFLLLSIALSLHVFNFSSFNCAQQLGMISELERYKEAFTGEIELSGMSHPVSVENRVNSIVEYYLAIQYPLPEAIQHFFGLLEKHNNFDRALLALRKESENRLIMLSDQAKRGIRASAKEQQDISRRYNFFERLNYLNEQQFVQYRERVSEQYRYYISDFIASLHDGSAPDEDFLREVLPHLPPQQMLPVFSDQ